MKIGIFGGCFNPPHNMHKDIAINLINNGYVDKVIYVPTGNKYNKNELIDAKHRYNMLKLMTMGNDRLEVSNYEIKNKLTYTYQTLDYFKSMYPNDEIYFVCGSDNLDEIETWKNYKYILTNYKLLVIKRNCNVINRKIANVIEANIGMSNISSTIIRNNIKDNRKMLDNRVFDYIKKEQLY